MSRDGVAPRLGRGGGERGEGEQDGAAVPRGRGEGGAGEKRARLALVGGEGAAHHPLAEMEGEIAQPAMPPPIPAVSMRLGSGSKRGGSLYSPSGVILSLCAPYERLFAWRSLVKGGRIEGGPSRRREGMADCKLAASTYSYIYTENGLEASPHLVDMGFEAIEMIVFAPH